MEGATSVVRNIEKGWVKKTLRRKSKKTTTHPISKQLEIQSWSSKTLQPSNGFDILFTPEARTSKNTNSYEMEKINTSNPVERIDNEKLKKEILIYFRLAKLEGYYPNDIELYEQPDGRIALLDFDKFGVINQKKKTVVFPFRGEMPLNTMPIEAIYSESLSKNIQNIMKGGRKRCRATRKK